MKPRAWAPKANASPSCIRNPRAAYSSNCLNTNGVGKRRVPACFWRRLSAGFIAEAFVLQDRDLENLHVPAIRRALHRGELHARGVRALPHVHGKNLVTRFAPHGLRDGRLVVAGALQLDEKLALDRRTVRVVAKRPLVISE